MAGKALYIYTIHWDTRHWRPAKHPTLRSPRDAHVAPIPGLYWRLHVHVTPEKAADWKLHVHLTERRATVGSYPKHVPAIMLSDQ